MKSNEAKSTLYLHIGTVKTGTTALQRFFDLNRDVLREKGIIYPVNKIKSSAHHRASWCFTVQNGVYKPKWPKDIETPEHEWQHLLDQINGQSGLVSSEHFFRNNIGSVRQIKDLTSDYQVKIIAYWRRRDKLEDAWANQRIKFGTNITSPKTRENLTSKRNLDPWAEVFGKENIIVRPYERSQLYKGDVLADFLHHILDFELSEGFILPDEEANTRIHRIAIEYKRLVNQLPISPIRLRKIRDPMVKVSEFLKENGRKDYAVFSPSERLQLVRNYKSENAVIAKEFLGRENGVLFYEAEPDPNEEWQPYTELLEKDAVMINQYLARHHTEALEIIVDGILAARGLQKGKAKHAALRLLPGIDAEIIRSVLISNILTPNSFQEEGRKKNLNSTYESRPRKAGQLLRQIYRKLPRFIGDPLLACTKWVYQKLK